MGFRGMVIHQPHPPGTGSATGMLVDASTHCARVMKIVFVCTLLLMTQQRIIYRRMYAEPHYNSTGAAPPPTRRWLRPSWWAAAEALPARLRLSHPGTVPASEPRGTSPFTSRGPPRSSCFGVDASYRGMKDFHQGSTTN